MGHRLHQTKTLPVEHGWAVAFLIKAVDAKLDVEQQDAGV